MTTEKNDAPPMQARMKTLNESAREALSALGEKQRELAARAAQLDAQAQSLRDESDERTLRVLAAVRVDHGIPMNAKILRTEAGKDGRAEKVIWEEPVPQPAPASAPTPATSEKPAPVAEVAPKVEASAAPASSPATTKRKRKAAPAATTPTASGDSPEKPAETKPPGDSAAA